jgi:hypothetical protein
MHPEVTEKLKGLRTQLSERVSPKAARPGTMVGWRTPGGEQYGVVVGKDGQDILVGVAYSRSLKNEQAIKLYRDESLSAKVGGIGVPGITMDIHRVPARKAYSMGRITGQGLKPYLKLGLAIQNEGKNPLEILTGKLQGIHENLSNNITALGEGKAPFEDLKSGLVDYLKTHKTVTVAELAYAFKGGSAKIEKYLASQVKAGVLKKTKTQIGGAKTPKMSAFKYSLKESLDESKGGKYRMWTGPGAIVKKIAGELKKVDCVSKVIQGTEHVIFSCTKGVDGLLDDPQTSKLLKKYLRTRPGMPGGAKRMHSGHGYARRHPNLPQDMQVTKG